MRITPARRLPVAVATAVTGALTWASTATAQPTEPTPSAAVTDTPQPDAGSISIVKKDPAGDILKGAAFLLLDATGQEAGSGTTDAQGQLTFTGLVPGVYRLKETTSGSPLHDVVADQDVIITPGATARLTIVDPFRPAQVLLKGKDNKTGKLLPGVTVNIGSGEKTLLTLTTGPKGTATGELAVLSRKAEFWVKQVKAPEGYEVSQPVKTFTAGPGAPVTVTANNTKTATTPKPTPTEKPTGEPTDTPSTPKDEPTQSTSGGSKTSSSDTGSSIIPSIDGTDSAAPKTPAGSLAHTGADATPWILGGAGIPIAIGIGVCVAVRARRGDENTPAGED